MKTNQLKVGDRVKVYCAVLGCHKGTVIEVNGDNVKVEGETYISKFHFRQCVKLRKPFYYTSENGITKGDQVRIYGSTTDYASFDHEKNLALHYSWYHRGTLATVTQAYADDEFEVLDDKGRYSTVHPMQCVLVKKKGKKS